MSNYRLDSLNHRWGRVIGSSLGVGGYLVVQALLAGGPIAESLLGGTIVAVALFLYYAILHHAIAQDESCEVARGSAGAEPDGAPMTRVAALPDVITPRA